MDDVNISIAAEHIACFTIRRGGGIQKLLMNPVPVKTSFHSSS